MNTAIARHLERSSEKTFTSFESLVSVAIFSGIGLLISRRGVAPGPLHSG